MKTIKNTPKAATSPAGTITQSTKSQPLEKHKITQVFDRSVSKLATSRDVERFWTSLNSDSKITSKTRDARKIMSISRYALDRARARGIPAQKIRDIYFERYRSPLELINALCNYIPELTEDLAVLSSSEQIDSRFRVRIGQ
jgi:hypothetical protein